MSASSSQPRVYEPTWESIDARPIPAWFPDAKFGIFVHWGVYSVPAWAPITDQPYGSYAEWYYARAMGELRGADHYHTRTYGRGLEYRDFAPLFTAAEFDPDSWAELFSEAGARYVVLTSKHHDGYCLWPTRSPFKVGWNSWDVGPRRDLVGDLTEAVRQQGLKMGLYYSLVEWETNHTRRMPAGRYIEQTYMDRYGIPPDQFVRDHVTPQLKELIDNYRPAVLFADGGEWDEDESYWQTKEFLAWLYNNAPNRDEVVVNDRWAKNMPGRHGDYYSSEYRDTDAVGPDHPWEESRGIGRSYGYNRAEEAEHYLTVPQLIRELVDVVSRGGNLLLNVGPTAEGIIPDIMQRRLHGIGSWLRVNGEAIYGTRPWAGRLGHGSGVDSAAVRFTRRGADAFAIFFDWPASKLTVCGLDRADRASVQLLGYGGPIEVERGANELTIIPPRLPPSERPYTYGSVYRIKGALH